MLDQKEAGGGAVKGEDIRKGKDVFQEGRVAWEHHVVRGPEDITSTVDSETNRAGRWALGARRWALGPHVVLFRMKTESSGVCHLLTDKIRPHRRCVPRAAC